MGDALTALAKFNPGVRIFDLAKGENAVLLYMFKE